MRVLVIVALFITSVAGFAQDTLYVWAESGLTLRETGSVEGEKIGVVPFGAALTKTGVYTESTLLTLLPSVQAHEEIQEKESLEYLVDAPYVEVEYEGQKGFVYGGYLSRLPISPDEEERMYLMDWLMKNFGVADTLVDDVTVDRGLRSLLHFGGDICYRQEYLEGGGAQTIIFPQGTLNEGYLLANYLFGLEKGTSWASWPPEELDFYPELLVETSESKLYFFGGQSEVLIQVVGSMLIISTAGWC